MPCHGLKENGGSVLVLGRGLKVEMWRCSTIEIGYFEESLSGFGGFWRVRKLWSVRKIQWWGLKVEHHKDLWGE